VISRGSTPRCKRARGITWARVPYSFPVKDDNRVRLPENLAEMPEELNSRSQTDKASTCSRVRASMVDIIECAMIPCLAVCSSSIGQSLSRNGT